MEKNGIVLRKRRASVALCRNSVFWFRYTNGCRLAVAILAVKADSLRIAAMVIGIEYCMNLKRTDIDSLIMQRAAFSI